MRSVALFFFVSFAMIGWSSDLTDFASNVHKALSESEFQSVIEDTPASLMADSQIEDCISDDKLSGDWKEHKAALERVLTARESLESNGVTSSDPKSTALKVLSNPVYRSNRHADKRNWLGNSAEAFWRWLRDLLRGSNENQRVGPQGVNMQFLAPVMWTILALGLSIVLVLVFLRFSVVGKGRKAKLLDDEEEVLSADKWLVKADELDSAGRHRDAVRCLYLACLSRLDEVGILKFVRSQTNWEHLDRFESKSDRPDGLEMRPITKEFDRVWYGNRVRGQEDVALFRNFYSKLLATIKGIGLR